MDLTFAFVSLASMFSLIFGEKCEPISIKSCSNAGYSLTARFPDIDGTPYQDFLAPRLDLYNLLLQSCSAYASTILCSLYLPKCEEKRTDPQPPCYKVCKKFATECQNLLKKAGLAGVFTVLCDKLPDGNSTSNECFYPPNFKQSSSGGSKPIPKCYDVVDPVCKKHLHYNKTVMPTSLQIGEETLFQSIINSNCSDELEKFICYAQFSPCDPKQPRTIQIPCKSLCVRIHKNCWKEFNKAGLPLPPCDYVYPEDDNNSTGICEVKKWPASWPAQFRPPAPEIGTCEELTVKSCAKANYKYTAKYLKVGNETFQQKKGKLLDQLIPYIESCSPYSSLILCSLYLPKCVPGSARPMLPCRQVCLDFVDKCKTELTLVSTVGMTIALCDLLPFYDGTPNKCIMPESFKMKDSLQLFSTRNVCYKVTSSKCSKDLHYDKTFLPTDDQRAAELTILQPVIDSGCSPDIEKYLCLMGMPKCTADTSVVHLPCREFCKRINDDCDAVLKANSIVPLPCDYFFPEGGSSTGQCDLKSWPAPWPWKIPDPSPPVSDSPTKCVPLRVESCANAGYYYTADFPPIDGKPYQMVKEKSLKFFLDFLNVCSKYSSTIMCSLFMPKCMEGHPKPVMPCRSVCLEFVNKCHRLLSLASHAGLFRSLCDLLPEQDALLTTCFVPKGFTASTTSVDRRNGQCSKIREPKFCPDDLHYNLTFVVENEQTSDSILQTILDSKCSPDLEKYLCYTTVPPCKTNDLSVYVPCRSVCEQVRRDCGGEFEKNRLPLPECTWIYPDKEGTNGLCQLSEFPVPWPAKRTDVTTAVQAKKSANKGGLIAGIVLMLGFLTVVVVIAVMYYRWRRGAEQFSAQRFDNVTNELESSA